MANIQIGKYKRPGVFIEEFDQSVIVSPVVEGINSLVIGVSKKGPFNTPIRLTSITDMESIFGQIDRGLERKGSFFHRTVSKMLETSSVYAMNLLLTDDELDRIDYKSISSSAGHSNGTTKLAPYRKFFDTTGFWKRDTDSFLFLASENDTDGGFQNRAFQITNLSDRPITVFIFKSSLTGFDRTLLDWYGSADKMPTYVNQLDYASDYMVDVVAVSGDWSNYQDLSVDIRWSKYFSTSGLRKQFVRDFANDNNVKLLAYYEGLSLIPYFRDLNGRNVFIETVINRDTEKTGLFCAFNNDAIEDDFYNGKLDLLGNTLVDTNQNGIDFLSYNETIIENVDIINTPLDLPGNVTSFQIRTTFDHSYGSSFSTDVDNGTGLIENSNRTEFFAEGYIHGVYGGGTYVTNSNTFFNFDYYVEEDAYTVIGDKKINLTAGTVTLGLTSSDYPSTGVTTSYIATAILNANGDISLNKTTVAEDFPSVLTSDIVLGYVEFDYYDVTNTFSNLSFTDLTIDDNGYIDLEHETDYEITNEGNGTIKINFPDTNVTPSVKDYVIYRRFKMFNRLVSLLNSPNLNKMAILIASDVPYTKYRLENATISNIETLPLLNKSIRINTTLNDNELSYITSYGYFTLYSQDNEIIIGQDGLDTKADKADLLSIGSVGKNSLLYTKFYNGDINTKDYFYINRLYVYNDGSSNDLVGNTVSIDFVRGEDALGITSTHAGYSYIVFQSNVNDFVNEVGFLTNEKLQFTTSTLNKEPLTIIDESVSGNNDPSALATTLGYTSNPSTNTYYYAYEVSEFVYGETLFDVDYIRDYNNPIYLKMYLDENDNMTLRFMNAEFDTEVSIDTQSNNEIHIQSRLSNYKQSIEIEVPTGYVSNPNKILVKSERYTELKVGDFLEAHIDTNSNNQTRKLTRVLSKRQYEGDPTLSEITCDTKIKTYTFGDSDLQTTRYLSIDNYASTYKAITLNGFKLRVGSLPDGTEQRQTDILNIVAKGSPLFKALTNKEAFDFRYLVDSFGLGLIERSKQQLVDICGERLDAFGFINMPSLKSFKNSSSPSFLNSDGTIETAFIAQGANQENSPKFLYSFADGSGTTSVGYFTPFLTINDNGKPLDFPPASYVATTYLRKHISNVNSITPWTIAAGVTNGRITNISGVEMDFTMTDIENLNIAQMNPIVYKKNRGYVIETENTGLTLYKSALSYIHVREVLIELERELSAMLLDFQWKFNTPDVRAEIKLRADTICEKYVNKNGLYNYFNKIDDENNTPDLIDNQIGVLDTYVEPIKGMGIIVNNITILRTGAISAGGFINS